MDEKDDEYLGIAHFVLNAAKFSTYFWHGITISHYAAEYIKQFMTLTMLCNEHPLQSHIREKGKVGFAGVNMFFFFQFLTFAQNIDCGCLLEQPHYGGSNEHKQSMFWAKIRKIQ